MLQPDYALWFCFVSFCAAIMGQFILRAMILKYKKTAFVCFLLAFVIAACTCTMGGLGIKKAAQVGFEGFRDLCMA
jgi:hypothetical protein